MDEMNEKTYLSNLFVFYRNLLTDKQALYFEYYYNQDYSLAEIADSEGVSRAAINDSLKNTVSLLKDYESKLSLYANFIKRLEIIKKLSNHVDSEGLDLLNELNELEQ